MRRTAAAELNRTKRPNLDPGPEGFELIEFGSKRIELSFGVGYESVVMGHVRVSLMVCEFLFHAEHLCSGVHPSLQTCAVDLE